MTGQARGQAGSQGGMTTCLIPLGYRHQAGKQPKGKHSRDTNKLRFEKKALTFADFTHCNWYTRSPQLPRRGTFNTAALVLVTVTAISDFTVQLSHMLLTHTSVHRGKSSVQDRETAVCNTERLPGNAGKDRRISSQSHRRTYNPLPAELSA